MGKVEEKAWDVVGDFFFQAEDGIRDAQESRGLGDVYKRQVPDQEGASLYIRPTLIAADVGLGVHASHDYLHYIIVGPVGPYFSTGFKPVAVYVSREHVRAVRGGTGTAKTGGKSGDWVRPDEQ